ncbi:MAG TPA: OmpA family protein [Terriglobales bacterium]|nr:OmpA family protein [Terriglobales bacterium]
MASSTASGVTPESPGANHNPHSLAELRELIVGPEQRELADLRARLDDPELRTQDLSQIVAEAIALRARHDRAMLRTLQPMIEEALRISVERDPKIIADSLFPIIGQAVRKAVAHSLRGMVESLNHILERSFSLESLKWRFEALRTGKSFGEIALMRSLRFRVEQVFLIHRETGLLLNHVAAKGAVVQDTDLVSGMLTAVQDFVRDSFTGGKSEELETMQVGEYVVWVQHGPSALLAAVVSGAAPPDLRNVFQKALEGIHADFAAQLSSFSGDSSSVADTTPRLQACLLGSQAAKPKHSYRWVWPVALLTIIIVGGSFYLIRQRMRWNAYVERLSREPGIILASEQRGWNSYSVVGLRDPLAADPEVLLKESGVNPEKVHSRWEPYSSLDPTFATARKLLNTRDAIEQQVIRFAVSSSTLDAAELAKLDMIQAQISFLARQAKSMSSPVTIQITGHTDRSGQELANALLSQRRAEEVRKALIARGMPPELLTVQGVGATRPAESQSDSYLEDLNRRVTFSVNLPSLKVAP